MEILPLGSTLTRRQITDEFTFITELSYHLSTRYQRPVSSIVVTLHHGACMVFGGTFDPAYVLSVFALPEQLQPTTNKRNASLIQKHMEEAIGVKPSRGFLRFIPTLEEHTARNGKTLAGEIDDLEKGSTIIPSEDPIVIPRSRSKSKKRVSVRVSRPIYWRIHLDMELTPRRSPSEPSDLCPRPWYLRPNPRPLPVQAAMERREQGCPHIWEQTWQGLRQERQSGARASCRHSLASPDRVMGENVCLSEGAPA
jgi:hypothetical protein